MGKEVRQGILFVVIILVAVIVIDLGNSGVSGEAVNRKGRISVAPSTPVISQYCGLSDYTQHVLSRIPGAVSISQIIDPQDATYQMFIVMTRDANQNEQWSLYNVGADGRISNDDQVYSGNTVMGNPRVVSFITADGSTSTNRKLFWAESYTLGLINIKSCNLPNCNNRITEVSLVNLPGNIQTFVPSLISDRIYMNIPQPFSGRVDIISCSRNQANSDWCGGPSANFITHITGAPNYMSAVRDSGFSYYDWTAMRETFFSIGNNQVVALPTGTYQAPIVSAGGSLGLLLKYDNFTSQQTELLLVDLNTGQSLGIIDTVASTAIAPWFITTFPVVTTFFQNDWSIVPIVFQSKITGQPAKTVWTETTTSSINGVVPTASGNVIAMKTFPQVGIVSFDCTP